MIMILEFSKFLSGEKKKNNSFLPPLVFSFVCINCMYQFYLVTLSIQSHLLYIFQIFFASAGLTFHIS